MILSTRTRKRKSLITIILAVVLFVSAMSVSIYATYDKDNAEEKETEISQEVEESIENTNDFSGYATDNPWDREKVFAVDEYIEPNETEKDLEFSIDDSPEYINVTITEMLNKLNENSDVAKLMYEGMYIKVTGYLRVLNVDKNYFTMSYYGGKPTICCYIGDKAAENMKDVPWGTEITIRGKIVSVGSNSGYAVSCYSIYW